MKNIIALKNIMVLSALIAGLAGCSGGNGGAPPPTPAPTTGVTVTNALLNGTWITDCISAGPSISVKASIMFNNGSTSAVVTNYSDDTCTLVAMIDATQTATYTLGVDVTVNGTVAGITKATQVDSTDTTPGPDFGEMDYDILAIANNMLYLGDSEGGVKDGTTPVTRPTQLDSMSFLTKQ